MTRTIHVAPEVSPRGSTADDPYLPIIADFRAAMTALKCASSERLLRVGISMAQLHILYTLQRTGEMPMSRLADVLNVSLSNATGLIDRIEERGFVERTRVPEDRRIVLIRVTDAGRRMLDEVDAIVATCREHDLAAHLDGARKAGRQARLPSSSRRLDGDRGLCRSISVVFAKRRGLSRSR